jgi:hypothetical protein
MVVIRSDDLTIIIGGRNDLEVQNLEASELTLPPNGRRSRSNPASHYVGLSGKKQGIEPGFPLNEGQIKILNGGFRLDVATTPISGWGDTMRRITFSLIMAAFVIPWLWMFLEYWAFLAGILFMPWMLAGVYLSTGIAFGKWKWNTETPSAPAL